MEKPQSGPHAPNPDKIAALAGRLREISRIMEHEVPQDHQAIWNECRRDLADLEKELEKGKETYNQIDNPTQEDREYYEGFLAAHHDQVAEIFERMRKVEETFYREIPEMYLAEQIKIEEELRKYTN